MPNPLRVVTDIDMARRYYELRYRSPHAGSGARQWVDRIFREGVARVFRQRVPISIDIAAGLLPRLCATSWHHLLSAQRRLGLRPGCSGRSEEHTSELQSRGHLVCRLLLEKKKKERTK